MKVKSEKGSYALIFFCPRHATVKAGRLGELRLEPGFYIYCGSAFGPGGVKARTDHHRQVSQRPHWHLDYLRPQLQLLEIWYTFDKSAREHQWAAQLATMRGATQPFPGFGSSDCRCRSHLIRIGYKPSFAAFRRRVRLLDAAHKPFLRKFVIEEGKKQE